MIIEQMSIVFNQFSARTPFISMLSSIEQYLLGALARGELNLHF